MKIPRTAAVIIAIVCVVLSASCRRDMQDQPKYKPLQKSDFFADGRSARPVPANTIAWDELNDNDPEHTGESNGAFLETIPITVNEALLRRGQDRFDIFCSPCHGRIGDGNGMIAQRGFRIPANLHTDRLRQVPPGYIFEVITNGYGAMPEHRDQIPVRDRWAIIAYVRALQLARNARVSDVPAEAVNQLGAGK